ncbi:serine hydrolase domain-containing protein [Longispora sp. K20-0274]|uniref:serine hydrolase domain-containing protein n=1 Tax=Longispora sp. K20-0274 TaxID=3088255 RepID=UPI00399BDF5B
MTVHGHAAPGYEGVAEAFARNLDEGREVGAALSVVRDGDLVVDLWGGLADRDTGRPWAPDTLQLVYSGTKALVATCVLVLVERGQINLDNPLSGYWPQFAARGKSRVTVAEVLSHQARLPVVHTPLTPVESLDNRRMAALLADQPQETDPRAGFLYHALTFGWLVAELIRLVDGRELGAFFADEIAGPLGLDLWIGLPDEQHHRMSRICYAPDWADLPGGAGAGPTGGAGPDPVGGGAGGPGIDPVGAGTDPFLASLDNPDVLHPGDEWFWNSPALWRAGQPGGGAVGDTRSMARLFGCLALGGTLDGVTILRPETVALGRREIRRGRELVGGTELAYAAGYALPTVSRDFGPPRDAFGHNGFGGSCHAAWPTQRLGVSYAPNQLSALSPNPCRPPLMEALHRAVR